MQWETLPSLKIYIFFIHFQQINSFQCLQIAIMHCCCFQKYQYYIITWNIASSMQVKATPQHTSLFTIWSHGFQSVYKICCKCLGFYYQYKPVMTLTILLLSGKWMALAACAVPSRSLPRDSGMRHLLVNPTWLRTRQRGVTEC